MSQCDLLNEWWPCSCTWFYRYHQDAGVTILGTVPSLVKTWKSTQCMDGLNWTKIKYSLIWVLNVESSSGQVFVGKGIENEFLQEFLFNWRSLECWWWPLAFFQVLLQTHHRMLRRYWACIILYSGKSFTTTSLCSI